MFLVKKSVNKNILSYKKMPNHCTIRGCLTNYKNQDRGSCFLSPKDEETQRALWLKFINFKLADSLKVIFV